ncbi:MAG: hypothetical protein H6767_02150 [Candidatus Peribacteria bacterium]|nr:MAG: hypothetical protein H6767_02150 [Candidatus Peribacteria bacterium]
MFLEYAIGDNYDLQKFGLILSGVCQFGEATDDATDVVDAMTYPVLQYLQEKDMISNTVSIQIV